MCNVETGEGCPWEGGNPDNWDPPDITEEGYGVAAGDSGGGGGGYPDGSGTDNDPGCVGTTGGCLDAHTYSNLRIHPGTDLRVYKQGKGKATKMLGVVDVKNGTVFVSRNVFRRTRETSSVVTNYTRFCDGVRTHIASYNGGC